MTSEIANDLASAQHPAHLNNSAPAPSPASDPVSDTREIELAILAKYGHDVSKFTIATPAPGGPASGSTGEEVALAPDSPRMPTAEAEALAAALIASGVPADKVNAALKAELGEQPAEIEDSRSDAQKEHDHNFNMDREFTPESYKDMTLAYREAGMIQQATPEAFQEWGEFLAAGAVPPGMGEGLVTQWLKDARSYGAMSDAEKTLYRAEERGKAFIAAGSTPEALAERGRQRDVFIQHMLANGQARVIDALNRSGALYSAYTFQTFANLGARIEQWRAGYPDDEK